MALLRSSSCLSFVPGWRVDTDWEFREALRREETDVEAEEVACILVGGGGLRLEGYGGVLGRE